MPEPTRTFRLGDILSITAVTEMLAAMLDSYQWDVWWHEWRDDLLVTDPPGTRTYLIGLRDGQDPVHKAPHPWELP